jgi:uncharacterized protein YaaQ
MGIEGSMKLVIAIIQDRDTDTALQALTAKGLSVTRIATSGGFLEQGNTTLLIGLDDNKVPLAIDALKTACRRRDMFVPVAAGIPDPAYGLHTQIEVEIGGATVFVLDVEHFEQV